MLLDIDRIQIGDRIRKDYGDLQELADDIQANTLLNPIVVTPSADGNYTLIAGERRLRAMRDILGYKQVTVNTVAANDAEHALLMEISENECRKEFTKTERLDYARRLSRIEAAKAKERMEAGKEIDPVQKIVQGRTCEIVASALGTNRETLRQEQYIADNADMLDPADFADWDEGRLSTNKAYQRIKQAKEKAERELTDALAEVEELERQNDKLYAQVHDQSEPQVVVREVVPRDYESIKADYRRQVDDYQKLHEKWIKTTSELEKANAALGAEKEQQYARRDLQNLISAINEMIRRYGGNVWAFSEWRNLHESTQRDLKIAVMSLNGFAQQLLANINELDQNGLENG